MCMWDYVDMCVAKNVQVYLHNCRSQLCEDRYNVFSHFTPENLVIRLNIKPDTLTNTHSCIHVYINSERITYVHVTKRYMEMFHVKKWLT